jgi:signal transduction histidine kinase
MPRVLFIQADEALRARAGEGLAAEGFTVDGTGSGREGIQRALAAPPDAILFDVHLPDAEGYELAARLKLDRRLSGVPLVAMGATAEERALALAAGADGFVARHPAAGLAAALREFLAGRRDRLEERGERDTLRAISGTMAERLEAARSAERRAQGRLVEIDALESAFMHDLSHQLSTPLTPIAGYLRILRSEKLGPLTPQQRRILDAMLLSAARLTHVVDNLSDFASLRAGRAPILEGPVQPDRLADEVVAELRQPIRDARLHVAVSPAGGEPVIADPRKLRQALANLVSNAVKFSPHGADVLVEVTRAPGKLRFAVYDQGPGIAAAEQEAVFEPMHHAATRGEESARPAGSGLGLPVARRIAEAHGGRVWVESPPRSQPAHLPRHYGGCKVVLEIPVGRSERPATPGPPSASVG